MGAWLKASFLVVATVLVFVLIILKNIVLTLFILVKEIGFKKVLKHIFVFGVWLFVVGSILVFGYVIYLQQTLPDPGSIATRRVGESTKIYDHTGQVLLYDVHGEEKRTVVPWENISDYVKRATLAAEDDDFYQHRGIDFYGIIRAVIANIRNADIASQGGSTITQQLVGNALVGRQKTYTRKIQEAILSVEIERRFTKDEIFWMYLNQIPYGSTIYGVEAASNTFFNKPAKDLNLNESATLAAIIQAPTFYSPYGNHADELFARKDRILDHMHDVGFISKEELISAKGQDPSFAQARDESLSSPHFVIMIREYLVEKYGEDIVQSGGLNVYTTLDFELQKIAEEVVGKYGATNEQRYGAKNAALVAIEPSTGKVRAMVGSRDYFNEAIDGNYNVATAKRQPGSAFKPFAYAVAINKGYPDSTILFDTETEFNPECPSDASGTKDRYGLDCYSPRNYDGSFRGPVTLRQALAQSLNIPSVKTLYLAGVDETADLATAMGISTLQDRSRFGLSLVLGGAEVKLVDMVSAYGVFANDGIRSPWNYIEKIESSDGSIGEKNETEGFRVLNSQTARMVNDILSDNNARAPVFGFVNALNIPGIEVAAKTGTTQENKDAWVVGYTKSLAAGVWTGNNDNKPMSSAGAGISAAGPMWNEFMRRAAQTYSAGNFEKPEPVYSSKPMLNSQYIGPDLIAHTILYYVDIKNPTGPIPQNPTSDPQFYNWETSVRKYYGL